MSDERSNRRPQRGFPCAFFVNLRRSVTSRIDSAFGTFCGATRDSKFGLAILAGLASLAVLAALKFGGGVRGLVWLAYAPKNVPLGPGVGGAGLAGRPALASR